MTLDQIRNYKLKPAYDSELKLNPKKYADLLDNIFVIGS